MMLSTNEAISKFIGVKPIILERKPLTDFQFECYRLVKARTSGGMQIDEAVSQVRKLLGTSACVARAIEQATLKNWKIL